TCSRRCGWRARWRSCVGVRRRRELPPISDGCRDSGARCAACDPGSACIESFSVTQANLYVVTGGAGFIGSNLVAPLLPPGDRVRVREDLSTGRRETLAGVPSVALVLGGLRDPATLKKALAGATGVFHQAALRSVPRSVDDPRSSNDVNVNGTLGLLLACRDAGVRRVVYASASSVYGDDPT